MGDTTKAPINEAVYLLNRLNPGALVDLRERFPKLSPELVLGQDGGLEEPADGLDIDRALIVIRALNEAKESAEREMLAIRARMVRARRYRKFAQVATLVCSSGVLGSLALFPKGPLTAITALLALLASIGSMLAEGQEGLLRKGDGDIYQAFDEAGKAAYEAGITIDELQLLIKHNIVGNALLDAIKQAQALCRDINSWIRKTSGSDPQQVPGAVSKRHPV